MKNQEIERRFLLAPSSVKKVLKSLGVKASKKRFTQCYLPSNKWSIRYRQIGKRYIKTLKRGEGLVRQEIEKEVSKEEFKRALKDIEGVPIRKNRYIFYYKNELYELDKFKGDLKGLVMLEIEFKTPKLAKKFKLPKALRKFIIREVTEIRSFTNHSLAINGLPTIV